MWPTIVRVYVRVWTTSFSDKSMAKSILKQIVVENSAPSQKRSSQSVRWAAPLLRNLGVKTVVDIGCGRLRNLKILMKNFDRVLLVDTPRQCVRVRPLVPKTDRCFLFEVSKFERSRELWDAAFLVAVLHIIPKRADRKKLLEIAFKKLVPGGYLLLDVPQSETYYAKRCSEENRYRDGWLMNHGKTFTFYRNYLSGEIDELIESSGNWTLFDRLVVDKHIIRLLQKPK